MGTRYFIVTDAGAAVLQKVNYVLLITTPQVVLFETCNRLSYRNRSCVYQVAQCDLYLEGNINEITP
jgi:hypothetical protein